MIDLIKKRQLIWYLRYQISRRAERLLIWLVWKLPPMVVTWAFIRVATYNERGNPYETTCGDAIERWTKNNAH
jgi:hypothetical protein